MIVHGRMVRDIHNYGVLDVTGVLQHSSNVGVTKMVLASPPEQLIGLLQRCGFGQRTESTYPGESEGTIVNVKMQILLFWLLWVLVMDCLLPPCNWLRRI